MADIPRITVVNEDGQWITADNRRLWVFRHLERLGKCDTIPVVKGYSIPPAKRTSYNGGKSITVRRNPGGRWYSKPSVERWNKEITSSSSSSYAPSSSDSRHGLPRSARDASRIGPSLSLQPMEFKYRPWETSCNTDSVDKKGTRNEHHLALSSPGYGYNSVAIASPRIDSVTNTDMTSRDAILQLPLESEQRRGATSDSSRFGKATSHLHDEPLNTDRSTSLKHQHESDVIGLEVAVDDVDVSPIEVTEGNVMSYVNMTEKEHHDAWTVIMPDEGFRSRKRGWLCCNIL